MTPDQDPPMTEDRRPPRRRGFAGRLFAISVSDIVWLIVACVIAGLVLAAFNVDPARLWVDFFGTLGEAWERFFDIIGDTVSWGVGYFLLGAVLVVPIWILWRVLSATGRNR